MATYSSILAWEIPGTPESDGLQSTGLQRIGNACVTEHEYKITLLMFLLNYPCVTGINPIWLGCMIPLMCWQIQFANISLKIFVSVFIRDIGLSFVFVMFFLVVSLSVFDIRVMLAL